MMSSCSNLSKMLSAMKREKIQHGVFVGIMLVLVSAAVTGETLEIILGLVGAVVVYAMKERSSRLRTCAGKSVKNPVSASRTAGSGGAPNCKKAKPGKTPICKSQSVAPSSPSVHSFVPRLHQAIPREQLHFADGLPLCEQVDELLRDVMPSEADMSVCQELTRLVSPCIKKLIPEAQIDVIAQNSVVRIGRTGLRPEVDLVVTVPPKVLAKRLLSHMREHPEDHSVRKLDNIMQVDENTLNKFAVRAVSAQLTFFKLWRTAYRGVEPKVVLLVPRCVGILSEDMHVHVYVNCPNIIRSKEVFHQSDSHVQKLIVFIRRWAQDRCIANTSYGHMPLYAWSLFAKYFCQSREEDLSKKSTIELFGEFVDFYVRWQDSFSQSSDQAVLQIEDPYDNKRNVIECMTSTGMKRFREELQRAKQLLANRSSLLTILEHCNPLPLRCVVSLPQGDRSVPESGSQKRPEKSSSSGSNSEDWSTDDAETHESSS